VRYEPAALHPTATGCQPGTLALGQAIGAVWPEFVSFRAGYGCWNPRRIEGSSKWSLHAEGRAIDTGVRAVDHQRGWEAACLLVQERAKLGVMRLIWDHHIWSMEKPSAWRPLSKSVNQHTDHIHVEQYWADAKKNHDVVLPQYTSTLHMANDALPRAIE